jgi:hypothetical protein
MKILKSSKIDPASFSRTSKGWKAQRASGGRIRWRRTFLARTQAVEKEQDPIRCNFPNQGREEGGKEGRGGKNTFAATI